MKAGRSVLIPPTEAGGGGGTSIRHGSKGRAVALSRVVASHQTDLARYWRLEPKAQGWSLAGKQAQRLLSGACSKRVSLSSPLWCRGVCVYVQRAYVPRVSLGKWIRVKIVYAGTHN